MLSTNFWKQNFFDITQQCFALLHQENFPANNLNFHWRWRCWDPIQAIFLNIFYFNKTEIIVKLYLCSWINVLAPLEVKLLLRSHWDCLPSWKIYKVNWIRFEIILEVPLLFFTKSYPAMFAHLLWLCTGVPLYWSKTLQDFYSTTQKHRWPFLLQSLAKNHTFYLLLFLTNL